MDLLLKIAPDGKPSFKDRFSGSMSLAQFAAAVAERCGGSAPGGNNLILLAGVPPKELNDWDMTLAAAGITSGSVISVRIRPEVVRRIVDADNSCLFNAVQYCMQRSRAFDPETLRVLIARTVLENRDGRYTAAYLGKSPVDYAAWIQSDNSWGGEVELIILSAHFRVQIGVVDVASGNVHIYGEGDRRIYLLCDGIHYDALVYARRADAPESNDITMFSPDDSYAYSQCLQLASGLHEAQRFVDLGSLSIQCLVCRAAFRGQKEAQEHAMATGHQNFAQR